MLADWHASLSVRGARLSLWRAVAVFRVVTLVACVYLILRWLHLYQRPALALVVGAGMIVVTGGVCWLALSGRAHNWRLVAADLAATIALTLATIWVQTPPQRHGGMPTLTTIWAAGPVIEAGYLATWLGGVVAALAQLAAAMVVRSGYDGRTLSSGLLLLVAGGLMGYVAALIVRAEDELAAATAARAAVPSGSGWRVPSTMGSCRCSGWCTGRDVRRTGSGRRWAQQPASRRRRCAR